jgi:hypothetical protein
MLRRVGAVPRLSKNVKPDEGITNELASFVVDVVNSIQTPHGTGD